MRYIELEREFSKKEKQIDNLKSSKLLLEKTLSN